MSGEIPEREREGMYHFMGNFYDAPALREPTENITEPTQSYPNGEDDSFLPLNPYDDFGLHSWEETASQETLQAQNDSNVSEYSPYSSTDYSPFFETAYGPSSETEYPPFCETVTSPFSEYKVTTPFGRPEPSPVSNTVTSPSYNSVYSPNYKPVHKLFSVIERSKDPSYYASAYPHLQPAPSATPETKFNPLGPIPVTKFSPFSPYQLVTNDKPAAPINPLAVAPVNNDHLSSGVFSRTSPIYRPTDYSAYAPITSFQNRPDYAPTNPHWSPFSSGPHVPSAPKPASVKQPSNDQSGEDSESEEE
jgi:hypothetical protein